jgi:hypothetical protein
LDRLVRANPRAIAFSVQPSFRPRSTISKPRTKDDDEDDDDEEEEEGDEEDWEMTLNRFTHSLTRIL